MTVCAFPKCGRPVYAALVCIGHYRMRRRQVRAFIAAGEKPEVAEHLYRLVPLRGKSGALFSEPTERVTISLRATTARAVRADVAGAREQLDRWASKGGTR